MAPEVRTDADTDVASWQLAVHQLPAGTCTGVDFGVARTEAEDPVDMTCEMGTVSGWRLR